MQILPGVFQLNGAFCGQTQNGYLIKTDQVTIMTDSGEMAYGQAMVDWVDYR